ncbi:hypothetical protein [Halococcus sp. IIIV-5B]|uniref:hypothetical protein n=1 Tax=Halococcus sp. IIIV-5B TaxID=2321230 RepID=UPI0011C38CD8|nr:hypothetical protein [Halococcus sp. IIIV-5B]
MAESALIYIHQTTADQDLDQQRETLWEYAIEDLEVHPEDVSVVEGRLADENTERSSHRDFLELLREEHVEHVIVWSVFPDSPKYAGVAHYCQRDC